ncbi:hypothetical protein EYF80_038507 [Liparis tanakae]|uniref:Uncharacterized protein n=1 Tax=Liparis tanakae TaxID=230148 RepID=A0A4Z2GD52_9TELE|nr:hypothetical protein EYF80_038507 [Liparis tanakae]
MLLNLKSVQQLRCYCLKSSVTLCPIPTLDTLFHASTPGASDRVPPLQGSNASQVSSLGNEQEAVNRPPPAATALGDPLTTGRVSGPFSSH